MSEWLPLLLVCAVGLGAGVLGGVIGFGTTIVLMPPLVHFYGPMVAVPVIALVAIVANLARVALWWRAIDWRLCATYAATSVPAVVLGAHTLVQLDARLIELVLGGFLLLMIPARRWLRRMNFRPRLAHMALVGAAIGYLTGIVASTGAINTPFFLAYGLVKGAYIGTEAASSLAVFLAKGAAFHQLGVIDHRAIAQGLLIGAFVFAGSTLSRRIVLRLPEHRFLQLMEAVMLASGLAILWMAW
ncbi:MAG: sulfite exporter TauE/SafE family protein [Chloroflexaceae bacterium]|nr:sulfite exporter TauE/SafE family protein [Chloroflexaceae bacterium]